MTIIGFALSKISAEKKKPTKGGLKVNNNVNIESIEKTSLTVDQKRVALKALFSYKVDYQPAIGTIELKGDVLFLLEPKAAEALLEAWKKDKIVPQSVSRPIVGHILEKCTIQALIISRDVGLPAPIPLPKIKKQAVKSEIETTKTKTVEKK